MSLDLEKLGAYFIKRINGEEQTEDTNFSEKDIEKFLRNADNWNSEIWSLVTIMAVGDDADLATWGAWLVINGPDKDSHIRSAVSNTALNSPVVRDEMKGEMMFATTMVDAFDMVEAEHAFGELTQSATDIFDLLVVEKNVESMFEGLDDDIIQEIFQVGKRLQSTNSFLVLPPKDDQFWIGREIPEETFIGETRAEELGLIEGDIRIFFKKFGIEINEEDEFTFVIPTYKLVSDFVDIIDWDEKGPTSDQLIDFFSLLCTSDIKTFAGVKDRFETILTTVDKRLQDFLKGMILNIVLDAQLQESLDPDMLKQAQLSLTTHAKLYFYALAEKMGYFGVTTNFLLENGMENVVVGSWLTSGSKEDPSLLESGEEE